MLYFDTKNAPAGPTYDASTLSLSLALDQSVHAGQIAVLLATTQKG